MAKKKDKPADAPAAAEAPEKTEAPGDCKHDRAYVAKVGGRGQVAQVCPDCGARQEAKKDAKPGARPMPLGQVERMTAQVGKLEREVGKLERKIKAAGPQSAEGKSLKVQLGQLAWKAGHAKRRLANAEQRASK